jgi:AraC-like DNA-binding protein
MQIAGNIFDLLILVGAIQGLISSILLFRNKSGTWANRFLAWILLLLSLACLNLFLLETDVSFESILWDVLTAIVPLVIIMPIGPLVYFYLRSLIEQDFIFKKKDRLHFYPILLDFIPSGIAVVYILGLLLGGIDPPNGLLFGRLIDQFNRYLDLPRWLSISFYLWKSWTVLKKSPQKREELSWPKQLLSGFAVFQSIWLLHLVPYLLPATSDYLLRNLSWYPVYIPIVILVYWLSIKGYLANQIYQKRSLSPTPVSLDPALVERTLWLLQKSMRADRLFLNPNLNMSVLVEHTQLSQKQLSAVLNQHLRKNFNEYVNSFRIEEVKKRLLEEQYSHLTIAAIAFDCGFNSLATFQRTFKSITQQTPKAFQQKFS